MAGMSDLQRASASRLAISPHHGSNDTEKENEAVLQLEISLLERIKLWDGVILASEANSSLAS